MPLNCETITSSENVCSRFTIIYHICHTNVKHKLGRNDVMGLFAEENHALQALARLRLSRPFCLTAVFFCKITLKIKLSPVRTCRRRSE